MVARGTGSGMKARQEKRCCQQLFEHHRSARCRLLPRRHHAHLPLVGILLNGTSLSTRMSPGRPSTRSAMMLRRISSVPPAMRDRRRATAASAGTGRPPRPVGIGRARRPRPADPSRRSRCPAASCPRPACRSSFPVPAARPSTAPRSRGSWCISGRSSSPPSSRASSASARSSIASPSSVIRLRAELEHFRKAGREPRADRHALVHQRGQRHVPAVADRAEPLGVRDHARR